MSLVPLSLLALSIGGFWWLRQRADHRRIASVVGREGGEVLGVKLKSWNRLERVQEVRFRSREGQIVIARCAVSLLSGVRWLGEISRIDLPLGHSEEAAPATEVEALDEPAACMACGATIPPWKSRCPQCGWSYKE